MRVSKASRLDTSDSTLRRARASMASRLTHRTRPSSEQILADLTQRLLKWFSRGFFR